MGRHASGPQVVIRGKEPVLYAVFADGSGKKAFVRIRDEKGRLISPGAPQHEIETSAWRIFNDRRRKATDNAEEYKTIRELTLRFVDRRAKGWSTNTRKRYVSYLEQIDEQLDPNLPLRDFGVEEAEDFLDRVATSAEWASGTRERFQQFCRALFNYARNLNWVNLNPFTLIPPPKVVPVRASVPFSEEEVIVLLAVAREQFRWFYPAIVIAVTTGARRSEICALRVCDYDRLAGLVGFQEENTKTKEENSVRLPPFAKAALEEIVNGRSPHELLIIKPSGKPLRSKDFDLTCKPGRDSPRAWRKLLLAAGLPLRGVHKLRSALVTNLINHGRFTIEEVVSITGQTPEVATKHYLKHRVSRQTPVVEHLEQLYGVQGKVAVSASYNEIDFAFEEL